MQFSNLSVQINPWRVDMPLKYINLSTNYP